MLNEQEQTFDTVSDWVESRREAREQAVETQEVETEVEETAEEPETEEIEAEAVEPQADEEISDADPAEEADLEASDEDSDEVDEPEAVEETPAAPAVEPPQHLKGNEREQFAKLPPEAQQMVAGLAKNGEALVTKKSQELSQTRQQLQQRLEGLGEYITETEQAIQYYDNVDWQAAYNACKDAQDVAYVNAEKAKGDDLRKRLTEAKQKQSTAEVEEHKSFIQSRNTKLTELSESNPIAKALTDSKDGVTRQKEVFAYMHENGMDRETLLWVPAEGLTMAYKAMMYDRANKKAKELPTKQSATPKAKPAPKTVKSTPSTAQGSSTNQRLQALSKKPVLSQEEFTEMRRLKRAKRKK
jgi:hypothetical protein